MVAHKISKEYYSFHIDPLNPLIDIFIKGAKDFCAKATKESNGEIVYTTHVYLRSYSKLTNLIYVKIQVTCSYENLNKLNLIDYNLKDKDNYRSQFRHGSYIQEDINKITKLQNVILTSSTIREEYRNKKLAEVRTALSGLYKTIANIDKWNN
jgi:hypothetical protein